MTTDEMIALVKKKHPNFDQETILELLVTCDANLATVLKLLSDSGNLSSNPAAYQQSTLKRFFPSDSDKKEAIKKSKINQGTLLTSTSPSTPRIIHAYAPDQVQDSGLPCSFHLNIFPKDLAERLLSFLVKESESWRRRKFYLFGRQVSSPHTSAMYSKNKELLVSQKATYNGERISQIRQYTADMERAGEIVQTIVRQEIAKRKDLGLEFIDLHRPWYCDVVLANCYADRTESVGYHADQLTHIGPGAVIASVSLGTTREFRLVPKKKDSSNIRDESMGPNEKEKHPVSVHLPHNSLIIMHAGCQEDWKHSLMPSTKTLTPHPVSGQKRLNLTYRMYLPELAEDKIPKCHCKRPMILRAIPANDANADANHSESISMVSSCPRHENYRYLWQCSSPYVNESPCSFSAWLDPYTVTSAPSQSRP